tara:strand:- start:421 stop:696 length:276 start_codon:yes stop_codon:yes gene_type:complete
MSENTKLDKQEIDNVKEIQTKYLQIQQGIGQIRVSLLKLNQQRDLLINAEEELNNKFHETQKEEKAFVDELDKKYGSGTLDIEKEIFIPNS